MLNKNGCLSLLLRRKFYDVFETLCWSTIRSGNYKYKLKIHGTKLVYTTLFKCICRQNCLTDKNFGDALKESLNNDLNFQVKLFLHVYFEIANDGGNMYHGVILIYYLSYFVRDVMASGVQTLSDNF